jgi:hypothetical protein
MPMSSAELATATPPAETAEAIIGTGALGASGRVPKPFVGLVPLEEENANLLAGRDDEIRVLTTNLRAARLTLVYGASGAGKSSLLRAGVVATLRRMTEDDLNTFGAPSFAVAIMNSWAGDPFKQLAESVREGIRRALGVETLPELPVSTDLASMFQSWTNSFGVELLIILDQFEEFFLYHSKEDGPGTFVYELPKALNQSDLRVRFLISLRDDSLYKLDRFQGTLPTLFENRVQILPLTVSNARQAIHKAIDAYNLTQPKNLQVEIEEPLIDAVLDAPKSETPGPDRLPGSESAIVLPSSAGAETYVDAPYMQLVMSRLWDVESEGWEKSQTSKRTMSLASLTRLGGAQAVMRQHVDRVMTDFSAREQRVAADCFYRLVTPGGSKFALTPEELEKWAHHPAGEIKNLLEKLVDNKYRLIRRVDKQVLDGIQTAYEVQHDRLARAMLEWQKNYYERRRQHLRQLIAGGIVLLLIIFFGVVGYVQKYRADRSLTKLATAKQQELLAKQKELDKTEKTAETAEETDRLKLTDLRALVPKFSCKNVSIDSREDIGKINKLLAIDCTQYHEVLANPAEALSMPRIYLEIQTDSQRAAAESLRQWLLNQKYNGRSTAVPGIENVGPRNLRESQLRYFRNDPSEVDWAWLIVTSLKKQCVDINAPQLIKGYEDSTAIKPLHFELWLTPDALNNLNCSNSSAAK